MGRPKSGKLRLEILSIDGMHWDIYVSEENSLKDVQRWAEGWRWIQE